MHPNYHKYESILSKLILEKNTSMSGNSSQDDIFIHFQSPSVDVFFFSPKLQAV